MGILIRILGALACLFYLKPTLVLLRNILDTGQNMTFSVSDLFSICIVVGGVGLVLLKEWGRILLVIALFSRVLFLFSPSLLKLQFSLSLFKGAFLYLLFATLLLTPKIKSAIRAS